jgi:spore photoproduct lyase
MVDKKGNFIKPCPGTPRHVCCGYYIIDYARGCNLGCTYCILDYYKNNKELTLFQNIKNLYTELDVFIQNQNRLVRFGTGEFTDSLLFEKNFPIYRELIPYIARLNNVTLEIKTKTVNIEGLLKIPYHDNIIVSWSLNSSYIAENEEWGAPSIDERINASYRMQREGYKLAFHFDPIIIYDKWEEGYKRTINKIFNRISPENVVYISMGTLRYTPEINGFLDKMGPYCRTGEFIRGLDNKMRYFRPLRTGVYKKIKSYLQKYVDPSIIYMCMESPTVWEDVFEIKNMNTKRLIQRLDNACINKFAKLDNLK